ncbi:tyrosine-type recombinase/integrase [Dyadobacter sp. LHD-138]|uniref:tyrosine-type recombinase/integrase n=1 Tax=Dyadobacter sp. LHD-138 TaxID=3071413 RepID=UPI0027E1AA08|nr:tyrosine-type recombinase/integrase [Dyadobacter sp. LHD-138]MDQ6482175.1 tyrosine-type recombinase/integrase [Dyadobacter sp. LHD-138]
MKTKRNNPILQISSLIQIHHKRGTGVALESLIKFRRATMNALNPTTISFKKANLEKLSPGPNRYCVYDSKVPGLNLTVYPSGLKTYYLRRRIDKKPERIKIGKFENITIEQARNEAKRLNSLITLGSNPIQEKQEQQQKLTFKELYESYYNQHALKFTKRPEANLKMMECHVFPAFGKMKAEDIPTEKIRQFHTKIGTSRAPGTANRLLTIISAAYNFGLREGLIAGSNPSSRVKKYRSIARDRFLSLDELNLFYQALDEENELFRDFFSVLLLTGARKSNVLSMRWQDISFDLNRWRIPESHTKNKDVNIVLLTEKVVQILIKRKAQNENSLSTYIFPGEGQKGYLNDPKKAFQRIKDRMNVSDIRMHDLRRTLGSYMAISGASLPMIAKALNHKSHASTAIYARLSDDPVYNAINVAAKFMDPK